MDAWFKGKIFGVLRKLSKQWPPRKLAKGYRRIDAELYSCELCSTYVYEGKSESNFKKYVDKFAENPVIWAKGDMDHKVPVVDVSTGFTTWDNYIERLLTPVENWQYICKECHRKKSSQENKIRNKIRKSKKTEKVSDA